MDRDAELAVARQAYAKQILAEAGIADRRICAAFAQVRREETGRKGPKRRSRQLLSEAGGRASLVWFGGEPTAPGEAWLRGERGSLVQD